jgi:hypothetical protein
MTELLIRTSEASPETAAASEHHRPLEVSRGKLQEFTRLEAGWHYGRGLQTDQALLRLADWLLRKAFEHGLWRSNAFPATDGGVLLTFTQAGHDIEIRLEVDGLHSYSHQVMADGRYLIEADELSTSDLWDRLQRSAEAVCTSESSTQSTSTRTSSGFAAWRSSHQTTVDYQSSELRVPRGFRAASVSTSRLITPHRPATPPSSGG